MAEPANSDSSPGSEDRDFDINAEAMVHEYDDERTIEEEEEANSGDSFANELDDLTEDANIPMEELLAMYYPRQGPESAQEDTTGSTDSTDSTGEILSTKDLTLDKDQIAQDLLPHESGSSEDGSEEVENVDNIQTDFQTSRSESPESPGTQRLLRSNKAVDDDSDSGSEDSDYVPPEDWKKTISVGSDYQAVVPEGLSHYDDAPAYENEDRLLWDPTKLENGPVNLYLLQVQSPQPGVQGVKAIPQGAHVRDDERALFILLQCGHNVDEALRRHRMQIAPPMDEMSLWSEEECRNFESGLRMYGKNFHLIQQNKVRTRSVGELVQFYYLWKKTARHDTFANQTRLSKRKYHLHPGITDYMDRFLDDAESMTSPTPAHSLLDRNRLNRPPNPISMLSSLNGTADMQNGSPEVGGLVTGDLPQEASVVSSHNHVNSASRRRVCVHGDAFTNPK
ncbi:mesoderm induction early response protein 1-like [Amphiura filiformis]|uniref:mesoderm induction early response protein 1-like n=1 Tax=Amphiura filiformis TaxID=82378 RepID=UPI003B22569C